MATRVYLPSTGTAAVTPSSWNFANQINPVTLAGVIARISSAMTSKTEATGTTNPTARAMGRHVIGPLAGQTISGTVKGQMRGSENNAGANATLALALKVVQPGGSDRGVLLAQTASDSATSPHELLTTLTNRIFENAAEATSHTVTNVVCTEGDYLVIEWGFRSATGTSRNITLSYGDDSGTDLPEDTTTTAANNPWIEFSNTIKFLRASDGAASGIGASSVVGASVFAGVADSDGVGAVAATSATVSAGVAASAGAAIASGDGEAVTNNYEEADGSASGTSVAAGVGAAVFAGAASSSAVADATGQSASIGASEAVASGVATAEAAASATAQAEGSSSAVATGASVGIALTAAAGASAGVGSVDGVTVAVLASVGSSVGAATALADGEDAGGAPVEADGSASGVGTAQAIGAAIVSAAAESQSQSSAVGVTDQVTEEDEEVGHVSMTTFSFWQDVPLDARRGYIALRFRLRIRARGRVFPIAVRGIMRISPPVRVSATGSAYGISKGSFAAAAAIRLTAYGYVDNSRPKRMRDEAALLALI